MSCATIVFQLFLVDPLDVTAIVAFWRLNHEVVELSGHRILFQKRLRRNSVRPLVNPINQCCSKFPLLAVLPNKHDLTYLSCFRFGDYGGTFLWFQVVLSAPLIFGETRLGLFPQFVCQFISTDDRLIFPTLCRVVAENQHLRADQLLRIIGYMYTWQFQQGISCIFLGVKRVQCEGILLR